MNQSLRQVSNTINESQMVHVSGAPIPHSLFRNTGYTKRLLLEDTQGTLANQSSSLEGQA